MSEKAVFEFLEASSEDSSLLERAKSAPDVGSVIRIAEERGFVFTEEEARKASHVLDGASRGALSDEELEKVAGGTNYFASYSPDHLASLNDTSRLIFGWGIISATPINVP